MPRRHKPLQHTKYRHDVPCARKRSYKSEDEARRGIYDAELLKPDTKLRAYQCPYCGRWHLSSVR